MFVMDSKFTWIVIGVVLGESTRRAYYFFKKKGWIRNSEVEKKNGVAIRQVLFFPDKQIACKDHFNSIEGCSATRCEFSHQPTGFLFVYLFQICQFLCKTIDRFLSFFQDFAEFDQKCQEINRYLCLLHFMP